MNSKLSHNKVGFLKACFLAFTITLLSGCGGGGGGTTAKGPGDIIGTGVTGIAAIGTALADATVTIKSQTGAVKSGTTAADGKFEINELADDGPFLLRADLGNGKYLYSVAHKGADDIITRNIHPYTDLIIRNWFETQGLDIDTVFAGTTPIANMPTEQSVNQIKDEIQAIVEKILENNNVASGFDLLSTPFNADGTGFDLFLDNTPVIINNNQITVIVNNSVTINNTVTNIQNLVINGVNLDTDFTSTADTPPTTPENVRALTTVNSGEVIVVWEASSDDKGVAGYNVYRNGALVATTPYPVFSDTGLDGSTSYSYEVEAIDGRAQVSIRSAASASVTVGTPDTTAPPAPVSAAAVASGNTITLNWTQSQINDVAGFRIFRGAAGNATILVATITTTSYSNFNLASGTEFCYRVEAYDGAGNVSPKSNETCATTDAVIIDVTAPGITLLGTDTLLLAVGEAYTDPGATASDNIDGDISANIIVAGDTVNTAIEGSYVVTYNISDAAGNAAAQQTRTVIVDGTAPIITLLGADTLNISVGGIYTDPGVTASDNIDGDITGNINVAGDAVDTAAVATFVVTYNVSDAAGNAASQITRTVNISNIIVNSPPVINSFSVSPDPAFVNAAATFSWGVSDANSDTLTCLLDIDNNGTTDFTISDCANNTSQINTYTAAGNVTAKLTVDDGIATPVIQTISFTVTAPLASLSTDVSVSGPVVASERVLYTITVGNTTALPIDDVVVSFFVPAELSFHKNADVEFNVSAGCGSSNCIANAEPIWNLGTLAAGENRTISVNALIGAATLNGVTISLPVKFGATGVSDIQINKNVIVNNSPPADLALSASTDAVIANETFTYNLDVGNTSAASLTTTELRAFFPPGVTVSSISDGGTEVNTGEIVWNIGTLGVEASLHREVTVTASSVSAGQILAASAQLTHDGGQAVDNTAEHPVTVVSSVVPLQVDISTSSNPVVAGERLLYTMTVSNVSLLPVSNVSVQLRVPAELSFHRTADVDPNVSVSCGTSGCLANDEPTWNLGTLAAGESRTISVNASVAVVLNGNLISTPVRVTATEMFDTISLIKTVAVFNTTLSAPLADLALSASTDAVIANETFTYNLDIGNTNAAPLTTTELRAFLPSGVTVSSISDGGMEVNTGEVVWNIGSLGVAASLHREVTVTASSVSAGQILAASAQLTHDGGLVVDNTVEHPVSVVSSATPLQVDVSTASNLVVAGERLLYTMTVSNISLLPADAVSVQLRVPAELSFHKTVDVDPNVSAGCGSSSCLANAEPTWNLGTLAAGESRTISVSASVDSVLSGNLISTPVRVTATEMLDTISLLKTVVVFNTPSADLALSASTDAVIANETFTYNLDVGNTSPASLTTTELRAFLPAGVTVSSISDGGMEVNPGEVVWNIGNLGVAASLHREVTVIASSVSAGQILKASAQLTHDGGQAVDNTAEHPVTVVSSAVPLQVDISTASNLVVAGERLLYTMTVSNISLLPVNNVSVLLRVPAELSFHKFTDVDPNVSAGCGTSNCLANAEPIWNLGTLAAGESRTISVNASVAVVLNGNLISTPLRVTATEMIDTISLLKTVAVFSAPPADLALSTSTDAVIANETFTYNLDVGNTSAASLTTTELRAFLPAGVTVNSISDGGTEVNAGSGEIVWSAVTLNSGGSLHREITVLADGVVAGDILKINAEVTHGGGLEIDNRSEFAVSVVQTGSIASLLSVDISATPDPVASAGTLDYTITVTNAFALPVDDVSVQLRVPAELSFHKTADVDPNVSAGCGSSNCLANAEPTWNLGTMAAGTSQVITINATVGAAINDGNLIVAPVRVTATGMEDTINLQHITVIQ